ncbi:MAG: cytochrome C prime [Proteobacteria bacterium]|jgi:Cytochrome c556|nr:MAG: cytochrome C prime [Pseudomonadota bacterium]
MIRFVSVIAAVALGATAVAAYDDVVKARQDAMKAIAGAAKEPGAALKGEAPFDLAKVHQSLAVFQEQGEQLKSMWPDGSDKADTAALPAVWQKKDDFLARFDKMVADAKAAAENIKDEASFKAEWPKVMSNCGGCHKEYRKPR